MHRGENQNKSSPNCCGFCSKLYIEKLQEDLASYSQVLNAPYLASVCSALALTAKIQPQGIYLGRDINVLFLNTSKFRNRRYGGFIAEC